MSVQEAYEKLLRLREGVRNVVYRDSLGKPTVGIGHLVLADDGLAVGDRIDDARVSELFAIDGAHALDAAREQAAEAGIDDEDFLPYLGSVNFQLGIHWTGKFPNTWAMVVAGDYEDAADALENTAWNRQTPDRVKDFQGALRRLVIRDR